MAKALREIEREGCLGGEAPIAASVESLQSSSWSYMAVLQQLRWADLSRHHARRDVSSIGVAQWQRERAAVYAETQGSGGPDRGVVCLQKESILRAMSKLKKQLGDLQFNLNWLKRCVEEGRGVGVGLGPEMGLSKIKGMQLLRKLGLGHMQLGPMGSLAKEKSPCS